jgi:hypothetical protein
MLRENISFNSIYCEMGQIREPDFPNQWVRRIPYRKKVKDGKE